MRCTLQALNATLPLHSYRAGFPMVVTVVAGGDWWDLSQVYRTWVLPNARWTKFGPLETRTDLPPWLENITLWMNNNWGGDPLGPLWCSHPRNTIRAPAQQHAPTSTPTRAHRHPHPPTRR